MMSVALSQAELASALSFPSAGKANAGLFADGTLLIYKPFRRLSDEVCFKRMQLQQALLYEAPAAVSGSRPACIKPFDNIIDGADAFMR